MASVHKNGNEVCTVAWFFNEAGSDQPVVVECLHPPVWWLIVFPPLATSILEKSKMWIIALKATWRLKAELECSTHSTRLTLSFLSALQLLANLIHFLKSGMLPLKIKDYFRRLLVLGNQVQRQAEHKGKMGKGFS